MGEKDIEFSDFVAKYGWDFASKIENAIDQIELKVDEIFEITDPLAIQSKIDAQDFLTLSTLSILGLLRKFDKEVAINILNCAIHTITTDEEWDKGKD